jgi:hypothetical protein
MTAAARRMSRGATLSSDIHRAARQLVTAIPGAGD